VSGTTSEADLVEYRPRPVGAVTALPRIGQTEGDVAYDGKPRDEPGLLERKGEPVVDLDGAAVLVGQPGQHPQQRRLARTAAPDQRHDLPVVDVKLDAVEDDPITELLAEPRDSRDRPGRRRGHDRFQRSARRSNARTIESVSRPNAP
jgi:hypothetical protein